MKKMLKNILIMVIIVFASIGISCNVYAAKNYTVNTKKISKTSNKIFVNASNKYTRHCLGLNYYLEKMRKAGGGTLTIKKGTYLISNSIYIPSNVKVVIKNGAVFKKISKTGTNYKPSSSMWQFVPKNKSKKKACIGAYNGTKNASIIAEGKVVFDMKYVKGAAIIAAHCDNVLVSGVTFKHMNGDHYAEVNGARNVTITNCDFKAAKKSTMNKYYNKEAVNIDTPDAGTHGLPLRWVKQDKTPCINITISNCKFDGTNRAIGTHNYSQKGKGNNVYHENIVVTNNTINNIYDNGIFILNWKNAIITNNKFYSIGQQMKKTYSAGKHAISGGGVNGITITGNIFEKIKRNPVYFVYQSNHSKSCDYSDIKIYITDAQVKAMVNNKSISCGNDIDARYKGLDVLFFRNNGHRTKYNAVGAKFSTGFVSFDFI